MAKVVKTAFYPYGLGVSVGLYEGHVVPKPQNSHVNGLIHGK